MQAVGAHLEVLRKDRGLSREAVAHAIGVSAQQVYRWERGENVAAGDSLAAFVSLVRGSREYVDQLLNDPHATADQGRTLAEQYLRPAQRQQIEHLIDELGPAQVLEAVRQYRAGRR